jgi:hypothetical protein
MFNGPVGFWLRQRWPLGLAILAGVTALIVLAVGLLG